MRAHIIVIGDELLNGRIADQNGTWLSRYLFHKGIYVSEISIVRDDENDLKNILNRAWSQSDLILSSGGLGPTEDDISKKVFGSFFDCQLEENAEAKVIVENHYSRISKRWYSESNHYHMIPQGFMALHNPRGLAPGLKFKRNNKLLLCAPGVPHELKSMMDEVFWPIIQSQLAGQNHFQQITMRTHGIPEEEIFKDALWDDLAQFGKLSSLPQLMGVDLLLTFQGSVEEKIKKENQVKKIISSTPLDEFIWQWGDLTLEEFIIKRAIEKNKTIAFAESCTGGLCASRLTDVSGSSSIFLGSAVTYATPTKKNILNVKENTINQFGVVSIEVAKEMAEGALKTFSSDIALSLTGLAGPTGGSADLPVGTLALGIKTAGEESMAKIYQYRGDRPFLKRKFSERCLMSLLKSIEK